VSGRVCVIEKKLQERFRKVSFADSEKLEIIVKPGQGAPTHREQNLRGLPKAHAQAAPSNAKKSEHIVRTAVAGLSGARAAPLVKGARRGPREKLPEGGGPWAKPDSRTVPVSGNGNREKELTKCGGFLCYYKKDFTLIKECKNETGRDKYQRSLCFTI